VKRKKPYKNTSRPLYPGLSGSFLFPVFVFWLFTAAAFGQEGEYRIEEDGHFVQTLRWREQENVLYYEVEIERQAGETWEDVLIEETEAVSIDISLVPGTYRYRIRVYDFLGKPAAEAEWIQFDVQLAKQPEVSRFNPEAFYLDEDLSWVLNLSGRNLTGGLEVYLQNRRSRGNRVTPETITPQGREEGARLVFTYDQLEVGEYEINVINPGGLKTSLGPFRIAFRKPVDTNISAGYRPLIALYGRVHELFETRFFPFGAYARLSLVPIKRRWGQIGFELEPSWNYLHVKKEEYEIQAQMTGGSIYGMYQWWFPNRLMTLNFRIGGGINAVVDYHFIYSQGNTEPVTVLIPAINAGASFQWFIKKPFFVETGVDFTHFFSIDNPSPGYIRPFLGAGWQF
jgi:hypothetical protein